MGELAIFDRGAGYSKSDLTINGYDILLYGQLYTNYETLISSFSKTDKIINNVKISKGYEVVIPSSGESSEEIARASAINIPNVIIGGDLNIIYPQKNIDPVFLAIILSNGFSKKEISKKAQGKTIVHINNSEIKKINVHIPNFKEQLLIKKIFIDFDNTITLHQRNLFFSVKIFNISHIL